MPTNIQVQYYNNLNYEFLYPAINQSLIKLSASQITSGILSTARGGTGVTSYEALSEKLISAGILNNILTPTLSANTQVIYGGKTWRVVGSLNGKTYLIDEAPFSVSFNLTPSNQTNGMINIAEQLLNGVNQYLNTFSSGSLTRLQSVTWGPSQKTITSKAFLGFANGFFTTSQIPTFFADNNYTIYINQFSTSGKYEGGIYRAYWRGEYWEPKLISLFNTGGTRKETLECRFLIAL